MGTTTYGGKGFKGRARVSGERPMGAASFGQQSIQASCQPAPLNVAKPTSHTTTPIPTHHPGWHTCHTRAWTYSARTMDGGQYDALITRKTGCRKGQVEGYYVSRRGSHLQVDIPGPYSRR